jgi:hypothetical protein
MAERPIKAGSRRPRRRRAPRGRRHPEQTSRQKTNGTSSKPGNLMWCWENSAELQHHCHPIMPNFSGAKVTNSNTRPPMDARQSSSRDASSLTMAAAEVLRHSKAKLAKSVKVTADLVVHVFGVLRQSLMDHQSCLHPSSHPDAKWQAP